MNRTQRFTDVKVVRSFDVLEIIVKDRDETAGNIQRFTDQISEFTQYIVTADIRITKCLSVMQPASIVSYAHLHCPFHWHG
ncbi:hypothetical protein LZ023_37350 (plasmid) [Pseudomonas silvicola]|nr:hypothetical protein LZ023_37350 [Pseudomonas silvicola]